MGYGDGTFQTGSTLAACLFDCFPRELQILDLNGDGKLDIAVAAQETNALAVLQGNGDGTFAAPLYFTTGNGPINMVAGPFTGRRFPDVLVVNGVFSEIPGVAVLLNTTR